VHDVLGEAVVMVSLFIFGCVVGGVVALLGPMVKQAFGKGPKALPPPGGPPENRGEAVRRVLKHLQRSTIAQLEEGRASVIVGKVVAIAGVAPLRSPLSNTECLGFHIDVRVADLDQYLRLPQLNDLARIVEIDVQDETGTVRVSAEGLELAITDGPIGRWNPPFPLALLPLLPLEHQRTPVTVEEGLLHPGMTILVCGVAVRERSATDYRDGASHLVLRASATFPLVASTDQDLLVPGDRPIAAEELHRRR